MSIEQFHLPPEGENASRLGDNKPPPKMPGMLCVPARGKKDVLDF